MLRIKLNTGVSTLFVLLLFMGCLVPMGSAQAVCQPGQMSEANLAYQSAAQFLSAQQWDQAISRLNSIVKVCPEHVDATRGLGTAFAGKADYAQAIGWFNKVVALRGDEVQAGDFANLGKSYAKLKKYKEARAEYMKAQNLEPDDCGVLFNLGVMHYASKYNTQSVEVLQHALEVCPQYRDNILKQLSVSATAAAKQQTQNGNNEKAAYYTNLMNQYGGQAGGATTYDMVKKKMASKKYNEAVVLLNQMLAKNPNQPGAALTWARAYDGAGDKAGSIGAYEKYFQLKPNDVKTYGTYVQVLVEAGQCSNAAAKAAAGSKGFASQGRSALAGVHYSWGLALECQEDFAGAKVQFQKAASSGNSKYSGPAKTQVARMDDFMKMNDAQRKKAAQNK